MLLWKVSMQRNLMALPNYVIKNKLVVKTRICNQKNEERKDGLLTKPNKNYLHYEHKKSRTDKKHSTLRPI